MRKVDQSQYNSIQEALTELVPKKGKSKAAVAAKLGTSGQLLGQYMSGKRMPKAQFLIKWKKVYGEDFMHLIEANDSEEIEKRADLTDIIGDFEERLLRIEVKLDTIGKTVIDVQSRVTGVSAAKLSLELERTTMDFLKLRLDGLKNG